MRIVFFVQSLVSDWNHGNAHFLRGLIAALQRRGHRVLACERWRNWSTDGLFEEQGAAPILEFARQFPDLPIHFYGRGTSAAELVEEVDALVRGADAVVVHEFNEPELVRAVGAVRRRRRDFLALYHDTHHRAVTAPGHVAALGLEHYDGVLAYGASLARVYRHAFALRRVWVFHEAADVTLFRPLEGEKEDDLVWIGNWGDEERTHELRAYLIGAARRLPGLRIAAYGVRYPEHARAELAAAGIDFRGWLANHRVPEAYARARLALHVPRGPYLDRLPGIPTIRPFEALACGIPLLSTPWEDREGLFRRGLDYRLVRSPDELVAEVRRLLADDDARARLAAHGLETVRARHTCDHRAEGLERIVAEAMAFA